MRERAWEVAVAVRCMVTETKLATACREGEARRPVEPGLELELGERDGTSNAGGDATIPIGIIVGASKSMSIWLGRR